MSDTTNKYLDLTGLGQLVAKIDDAYLKKVTSTTTYNQLYGKNASGNPVMIDATGLNIGSTLVLRGANGIAKIGYPQADADIANKKYVDDLVPQIKRYI